MDPEEPADWWRKRRGGRPGAVLKATNDALGGTTFAGSRLVTAALALDVADLVDGARKRQDPVRFLAAADRLEKLVAKLGLDDVPAAVPVVDDGGLESGAGGDAVESDPLADVLGAGPEVGDGSDAE